MMGSQSLPLYNSYPSRGRSSLSRILVAIFLLVLFITVYWYHDLRTSHEELKIQLSKTEDLSRNLKSELITVKSNLQKELSTSVKENSALNEKYDSLKSSCDERLMNSDKSLKETQEKLDVCDEDLSECKLNSDAANRDCINDQDKLTSQLENLRVEFSKLNRSAKSLSDSYQQLLIEKQNLEALLHSLQNANVQNWQNQANAHGNPHQLNQGMQFNNAAADPLNRQNAGQLPQQYQQNFNNALLNPNPQQNNGFAQHSENENVQNIQKKQNQNAQQFEAGQNEHRVDDYGNPVERARPREQVQNVENEHELPHLNNDNLGQQNPAIEPKNSLGGHQAGAQSVEEQRDGGVDAHEEVDEKNDAAQNEEEEEEDPVQDGAIQPPMSNEEKEKEQQRLDSINNDLNVQQVPPVDADLLEPAAEKDHLKEFKRNSNDESPDFVDPGAPNDPLGPDDPEP